MLPQNIPSDSIGQGLENFFQISSELMGIIGSESQWLQTNPALDRILDKPAKGKTFLDFVHPDELQLVKENLTLALSNQDVSTFACRLLCKNNSEKWFLWRIYPQANGQLFAVGKDISIFREFEAMENARNNFSDALLDTVLAINSSLSFEEVLAKILLNVGRVVAYDYVSILLIEDDYAYVAAYQSSSLNPEYDAIVPKMRLPIADNYYLRLMLEKKKAVIVSDILNDQDWTNEPGLPLDGSYLGSPIIVKDEVIGFLDTIKTETDYYTSIHARQLFTFAMQIAVAMNNAQVYEQAKSLAAVEERQRLAAELHDSVSQSLYAANALAGFMPKVLEKHPEKTLDYAKKIGTRIQSAIHQMRLVLIELYPDAITKTELEILLRQLCAAFGEGKNLRVELETDSGILLKAEAQMAFYRIAQEALHNVEKHAKAKNVRVSLRRENHSHVLIIEDDGLGFDLQSIPPNHFGIKNIHERARSIGADLAIESSKGTKITLVLEDK